MYFTNFLNKLYYISKIIYCCNCVMSQSLKNRLNGRTTNLVPHTQLSLFILSNGPQSSSNLIFFPLNSTNVDICFFCLRLASHDGCNFSPHSSFLTPLWPELNKIKNTTFSCVHIYAGSCLRRMGRCKRNCSMCVLSVTKYILNISMNDFGASTSPFNRVLVLTELVLSVQYRFNI